MERLLYIGPDLMFLFTEKHQGNGNGYNVTVKAAGVKLDAVVDFKITNERHPNGATECLMNIGVAHVAGPPVALEVLNKAINCLTVNNKQAGEVCCAAFLNGFLDSEF